jgi:hypothetical protein
MRRIRRAILGPRRRRPSAPAAHPALERLRQAHALFDRGEYGSAAIEFHDLAERGEAAGLAHSSRIYLLAGRAYVFAGQAKEGMHVLQRGIQAAARFGQLGRLANAAPRITSELRQHGFEQEAEAFVAALESVPNRPLAAPSPAKQAPRLPPKCPYCGGTVHPDEAEWIDPRSIACDYCGSIVQAAEA